ncbi:MAG TPA: 2-hydroxychromene-2-carboxylate isomerase [Rhodoblastus sp.]|nr:2-hydroxychromene-2-carboxylate isomerase [Rhodoblastus sp.]
MKPGIEHFFTPVSGFAYLGHEALLGVARAAGVKVRQRPVDIGKVFAACGVPPPAKQSEAKLAWRRLDMRRWAERRGLPLKDRPRFWPVDGARAARAIVALDIMNGPVDRFVSAVFGACWARDLDIAEARTMALLLDECGADVAGVMAYAESGEVEAAYQANTRDAIAAGAIGSPFYRVGDEVFFGQDRLDFVQSALAVGA